MRTKATEHNGKIQSPAHQDYPVAILIRIRKRDSHYEMEAHTDSYLVQGPIEMTEHDLAALNRQLHTTMASLAAEIVNSGKPSAKALTEQIRPLAVAGRDAFNSIFKHRDLAVIRDLLTRNRKVNIQIVTEGFFLPWELLYSAVLDKSLDYKNFWGMNYIISRVIAYGDHPGTRVSPEMIVASRPRVGLLFNSDLEHVVTHERPYFKRLADQHKILLDELGPLYLDHKPQGMREFQEFWQRRFHVVHFACHAFYEDQSPRLSYVLLTRDFPITLQEMDAYGMTIDSYPLVVMNACETGNLNPLYTSHFAASFLESGARGVVATDCAVSDAFAAEFAGELYARLLAGKPLGESLLAVRQHFLKNRNDPSGLLYSMYASPSIRLSIKGDRNG
jgi:hypothetical protein